MLQLKPQCESCGSDLPPNATNAMICSFECTYCQHCAETVLHNTCPNCGGGFEKRPVRPEAMLEKHPASTEEVNIGVDQERHLELLRQYRGVSPERR